MCVAIFHSLIWIPIFEQLTVILPVWQARGAEAVLSKILIGLTHGTPWVDFFFVLSGFVLARSIGDRPVSLGSWGSFVARRAIRIMPTLFVALVVMSALLWVRAGFGLFPDAIDGWYPVLHNVRVSWMDLLNSAMLQNNMIIPPAWSLKVEMIAGAAFPLVYVASRRLPVSCVVLLTAIWAAAVISFPTSSNALNFGYMFVAGIAAARAAPSVSRLSAPLLSICAAVGFMLICIPPIFWGDFGGVLHSVATCGSALLVAALANSRPVAGFGWLDSRAARFLGRISFSFYLLHFGIMYGTVLALTQYVEHDVIRAYPLASQVLVAFLSITIAVPLSSLMYRFVEMPSVLAGKWLLARSRQSQSLEPSVQSR
ncbi:acyltransferase [Pseudomonas sp. PDM22]|nr:acyltransferase [Pseudomonas sp. PDM22]